MAGPDAMYGNWKGIYFNGSNYSLSSRNGDLSLNKLSKKIKNSEKDRY